MNETRKKIIELVSEYMDKTLEEGCLCLYGTNIVKIGEFDGLEIVRYTKEGLMYLGTKEIKKYNKIIGHYDISAVLKYIRSKGLFLMPHGIESICFRCDRTDNDYVISCKPLHLYTEEEDKQLLEILEKIKL